MSGFDHAKSSATLRQLIDVCLGCTYTHLGRLIAEIVEFDPHLCCWCETAHIAPRSQWVSIQTMDLTAGTAFDSSHFGYVDQQHHAFNAVRGTTGLCGGIYEWELEFQETQQSAMVGICTEHSFRNVSDAME